MNALQHNVKFIINGESYEITVCSKDSLLDVLRETLGLTGTKKGCNSGECGACTVIVDGKPVNACLTLAVEADGKEILTIEGLSEGGKLSSLQESFLEHGAVQCGYCTPGMIMSSQVLLNENPVPSEEEIRNAIAGNFCRCTGYTKIIEAIGAVAVTRAGKK
jgi:carbon-monoxide dehydrogenase small subunit